MQSALFALVPSVRRGGARLTVARSLVTSSEEKWKKIREEDRDLSSFITHSTTAAAAAAENQSATHDLSVRPESISTLSYWVDTYGCQQNHADTEVVASVLESNRFVPATAKDEADVILLNTCAIRDSAEERIWGILGSLKGTLQKEAKKGSSARFQNQGDLHNNPYQYQSSKRGHVTVGVLGCMAERLKSKLLESKKAKVDLVVGPDAYRQLPDLIRSVRDPDPDGDMEQQHAAAVQLSVEETYADIKPVRKEGNGVSAWCSIMRGCNNMCSFCIVPFTRGRERSRPILSIMDEIRQASDEGYKEVTLLGQNVNSYHDRSDVERLSMLDRDEGVTPGFSNNFRLRGGEGPRFANLLHEIAQIDPEMRIRYTSPHPKDFPMEVLDVMKDNDNICNYVHLPIQSGSSSVLDRMRRGHSREAYLELVNQFWDVFGKDNITFSSDIICGFCDETEEEHQDTMSLLPIVEYDAAYIFMYSLRDKTHAYHRMNDNVCPDIKKRRMQETLELFRTLVRDKNKREVGREHLVLVEGHYKRTGETEFCGRSDTNKLTIFENCAVPSTLPSSNLPSPPLVNLKPGDYVAVQITGSAVTSLKAKPLYRTSIQEYYSSHRHSSGEERFEGSQVSPLQMERN